MDESLLLCCVGLVICFGEIDIRKICVGLMGLVGVQYSGL